MPRILIVDDDPIVATSLAELLGDDGHDCVTAHDGQEALDVLADAQRRVELLITDMDMPRVDGRALLKRLRDEHPGVVPLVLTGFGKIEDAVESVKLGAADYLTKPVLDDELKLAVSRAAQTQALLAENQSLRDQIDERFGVGSMIGADYRMQRAFDVIESVADSPTTILITGEEGTGKTLAAHAVHQLSARRAGPYVSVLLEGKPESLQYRELFGQAAPAPADASRSRPRDTPGRLHEAQDGTLVVRGIEHAGPTVQEQLLRVLQERRLDRNDSSAPRATNARLVFTAGRGLAPRVESGVFRRDLYYRINVVPIALPALRDRPGDVELLAEHFVEQHGRRLQRVRRLSPETVEALSRHDWPGNVRELEAAMERAVLLSPDRVITPADLPAEVLGEARVAAATKGVAHDAGWVHVPALADGWTPTPLHDAVAEPERQILLAALEANDWNRSETARQLGVDRTTLYKKIKKHRLDEPG